MTMPRWMFVGVGILVVVFALVVRCLFVPDLVHFANDEARDLAVAVQSVHARHLPLTGPPSSIGSLKFSPIFYWMYMGVVLLSESPVAGSVATLCFSLATVLLCMFVAFRLGGRAASLVAGVLYACGVLPVMWGVWMWNPNLIPFFVALACTAALFVGHHTHWRHYAAVVVLVASVSVAMQLHIFAGVLLVSVVWLLWKMTDSTRRLSTWWVAGTACAVSLLPWVPAWIRLLQGGGAKIDLFPLGRLASDHLVRWAEFFVQVAWGTANAPYAHVALLALLIGSALITVYACFAKHVHPVVIGLLIMFYSMGVSMILFPFVVQTHYFSAILVPTILLLAVGVGRMFSTRSWWMRSLGVLVLVVMIGGQLASMMHVWKDFQRSVATEYGFADIPYRDLVAAADLVKAYAQPKKVIWQSHHYEYAQSIAWLLRDVPQDDGADTMFVVVRMDQPDAFAEPGGYATVATTRVGTLVVHQLVRCSTLCQP